MEEEEEEEEKEEEKEEEEEEKEEEEEEEEEDAWMGNTEGEDWLGLEILGIEGKEGSRQEGVNKGDSRVGNIG
ncbi:hypothetical protein Pmani_036644 [Petrolisthes manimaculis]|uniref:Uncharacterized protein n=1 Tax=Petrolisthes manimaculis TaxID=1843537 RepID=A0AAE1TMH1_9EUCA|nr:hypothetical protein Pmani_036644 [Petrolisthes manimaculis]